MTKTIVITGATSGFGRACAVRRRRLAADPLRQKKGQAAGTGGKTRQDRRSLRQFRCAEAG
jgi:NAD(P)-dependent dehydrogenase (short-subunit alcohol dehydrogenase family)